MSDGQIVPKNLEDFQGALDKVVVVGLTFNDQEVILLLSYPTKLLARLCHDTRECSKPFPS